MKKVNCLESLSTVSGWQELGYLIQFALLVPTHINSTKGSRFRVYRKLITCLTIAKGVLVNNLLAVY